MNGTPNPALLSLASMAPWLRGALLGLLVGAVAGCGQGAERAAGLQVGASTGTETDQNRNAFGALLRGLSSAVIPGRTPPPAGFTATRASLVAQGFDQPLLTAEIRDPDGQLRKAGLLQTADNNNTARWQGGDGSGLTTRGGVVLGSAGLQQDAYSIEAAPTLAALAQGGAQGYRKDWRHITGLNQLRRTQMSCTLAAQGRETISVLGRAHVTTRYLETCTALTPGPLGDFLRIENRYWQGLGDGVVWRSEQWISPKVGRIRLERVFL